MRRSGLTNFRASPTKPSPLYPELEDIDHSGVTQDNWREWLAEQVERYGETRAVPQLSADEHESIDPLLEAADMLIGECDAL